MATKIRVNERLEDEKLLNNYQPQPNDSLQKVVTNVQKLYLYLNVEQFHNINIHKYADVITNTIDKTTYSHFVQQLRTYLQENNDMTFQQFKEHTERTSTICGHAYEQCFIKQKARPTKAQTAMRTGTMIANNNTTNQTKTHTNMLPHTDVLPQKHKRQGVLEQRLPTTSQTSSHTWTSSPTRTCSHTRNAPKGPAQR